MAETPAIAHAIREALAALCGAVVLGRADGGQKGFLYPI